MDDQAGSDALGASYHVVDEWPALRRLKNLDVPASCTVDPGDIDKRFRGMAPGRLVPLLIVWLQELQRRVVHLEGELARHLTTTTTTTTGGKAQAQSLPPPGWFANWAPWSN